MSDPGACFPAPNAKVRIYQPVLQGAAVMINLTDAPGNSMISLATTAGTRRYQDESMHAAVAWLLPAVVRFLHHVLPAPEDDLFDAVPQSIGKCIFPAETTMNVLAAYRFSSQEVECSCQNQKLLAVLSLLSNRLQITFKMVVFQVAKSPLVARCY